MDDKMILTQDLNKKINIKYYLEGKFFKLQCIQSLKEYVCELSLIMQTKKYLSID